MTFQSSFFFIILQLTGVTTIGHQKWWCSGKNIDYDTTFCGVLVNIFAKIPKFCCFIVVTPSFDRRCKKGGLEGHKCSGSPYTILMFIIICRKLWRRTNIFLANGLQDQHKFNKLWINFLLMQHAQNIMCDKCE